MKPDTAGNAAVGIGGTLVAIISPEKVAILAGLSTTAWMLWQLGCSIYDRRTARRRENRR